MAAGWASRPSSDGGGETDGSDIDMAQQVPQVYEQRQPPQPSQQPHHFQHLQPYYDERDGEDVEEEPQPTSSTPGTAAFSGGPEGRRRRGSTGSAGGGTGARGAANKATSGVKKRRQRNAEQMESNRVAQQKQRKKQEQSVLQQAVDLLTAQVATLKAVEVRAGELEATNISLQETVRQQGASIAVLQQQNASQAAELEAVRGALHSSQSQVAVQGKIILDQQAKLRLQEQVIASLKDRLKERIDEAMQHVVPGTVCEKMVAAVKATLYDAKDVHGLQETLAQLPEHLVNEMCKNIFQVCKEFWPEMRARCSQQVGGSNSCHMTGTA
ncbi:hypothetical protein VOLCADRAFT_91849 [Volvox carteri f. nagariensis]|uniref:Uncharacterized protein n=1 Tax=Volvox carteri f. nagariensis TaxID=3068 RepID=D8TY43_VOLCA|nr:uncharacterized protein VOLCADRAFT_91849 [Volvox carteri f. nagariensis]EFJ47580.1 hypothetical protein VOLCADRAFT_91849 [Volvox carteri f. nagariensis]|eukprot:XP_002951404.1 hypothetical protein VOLCADRAFT_91849 [Volvox carteri f. nagariensis]